MRKFLLLSILSLAAAASDASVVLDGNEYSTDSIFRREVGPGIIHTRYRIPDYPLNVYTIEMDMNNKYNRIETTQPLNRIGKNERLADAYERHKAAGKHPIAGANASFWCVTGHGAAWQFMLGTNFGGCVVNDTIMTETNMHNNIAYGGKGIISVDHEKTLWFDAMSWYGEAKCSKWDKNLEIIQFNKICNNGEMAVFTRSYGDSRTILTNDDSENVFLTIDAGQTWGVNKDMTATVKKVTHNCQAGTLGEYDLCITGNGSYTPYLSKLEEGDKVSINHGWTILDTKQKPDVENLLEGNVLIMKNGEVLPENDTDGYCSMVYSRCGYGASKDGKKLFIIVIDMSTNEYGQSKGCPSRIMAQILKQMGCSNAVNMDAGGSAQMMVDGRVVNTTTEGSPRAVSTSWLLFSTAPRSSEIARIEFDDISLRIPTNAEYSPRILGYNQYGDLVSDNVEGVTFSCDASLASCNGNTIKATSTPGYGALTAEYNGIKVSKALETKDCPVSIRLNPIIIDNREYRIEVISELGRTTFKYDPEDFEWSVANPEIASIENGRLKGLKNGTTEIECKSGMFSGKTEVQVQIAPSNAIGTTWSNWSLAGTGVKNFSIDADGNLAFSYNKSRIVNIRMANNSATFFGLPDNVVLEFTSPIAIESIKADLRNPSISTINNITFTNDGKAFEAGKRYTIDMNIARLGDLDDLQTYPISLHSLTFALPSSGVETKDYTLNIHRLEAIYGNHSGVETVNESDTGFSVYPNPVTDGILTICSTADNVEMAIYSLEGRLVKFATVKTSGGATNIDLSDLPAGVYLLKGVVNDSITTSKLIVR